VGLFTNQGFHGLERRARSFSGARGVWVAHPPGQMIGQHRHDWPFLMLPALGDCLEHNEAGETRIAGPSAVLHPAGTCHANCIGAHGLETISIEFDPAWIGCSAEALAQSRIWIGGAVGAAARGLAATWLDATKSEGSVATATAAFLRGALTTTIRQAPHWLADLQTMIESEPPPTAEIARRLDLHPAWLAHAYREAAGEGLHETIRRNRVERAATLLRTTGAAPASIAQAAGFCDQSHMNRCFKAVLGRTPLAVRAEGDLMTGLSRA